MKNTMHLSFDLIGAHRAGEHRHAQDVMESLGITYIHATPQTLNDSWWFWCCQNVTENLPAFVKRLDVDPMEFIGFGLSEDVAKKISESC